MGQPIYLSVIQTDGLQQELGLAILTDSIANPVGTLEPVKMVVCEGRECGKTISSKACVQTHKCTNFCVDCVRKSSIPRSWFAEGRETKK